MDDPSQATPPRLIAEAKLEYPEAAAPTLAHGDITMRVLVGTEGLVTNAEVVSGPEVFHEEALAASFRLRFEPAQLAGTPVEARILVRFHFAPPQTVAQGSTVDEVVVLGDDLDRLDTHARTTLREAELERAAGQDLANTVSIVPGVVTSRGTADATKPLIRGQTERRLLILNDGVRHESQKWGPDHAPEVDPFSAGTIGVVKGAAGARYGPDAIGGVLLVDPPPMRDEAGVGGKIMALGATNGRRGYAALRLDAVPAKAPNLSMRLEGNINRGASQQAPDYVLGNTATFQWNLGGAIQLRAGRSTFRATYRHYDLLAGIYYGVRNTTPDEFLAQIELGQPPTADVWTVEYKVGRRPYQDVHHDRVTLHWNHEGRGGSQTEAIYAFQNNQREEFDHVRSSIEGPQFFFTLRTHSLDFVTRHGAKDALGGKLTGGIGAQGIFQENVYRGLTLLPNYRGFGGGIFGFERLDTGGAWAFEAGARFDALDRASFLDQQDLDRADREGALDVARCPSVGERYRCPGQWATGSLSLGALWHVIDEVVDMKFDLSSASRFPSGDELYLNGTAPTFPVYSVANPNLTSETTWNASSTLGLRLGSVQGEISAWGSYVEDYIYFGPAFTSNGNPRFDVTVRGTWPRYEYTPIPATFYGADGALDIGVDQRVGARLSGAIVRSRDLSTGAFLIGTPADRASASVFLRPGLGQWRNTQFALTVDAVARQSRTDPDADFAPVPDGYALLSASVETEIPVGPRAWRVGVSGFNLLNARYREYTSLLRYYGDFPGRDVQFRISVPL